MTALDRFLSRVEKVEGGCWIWHGRMNNDGYGSFWNGLRRPGPSRSPVMVLAHRWAYQHFVEPIPPGMCVLHSCDVPACVNPDHLFFGTQRDNVRDCIEKGRHYTGRKTLTAAQIQEVRSLYSGEYGDVVRLAAQFSVKKKVIHGVIRDLPRRGRLLRSAA